jgi:hypothetical protein
MYTYTYIPVQMNIWNSIKYHKQEKFINPLYPRLVDRQTLSDLHEVERYKHTYQRTHSSSRSNIIALTQRRAR